MEDKTCWDCRFSSPGDEETYDMCKLHRCVLKRYETCEHFEEYKEEEE